jgi:anti-anti-sigma factor
MTARPLVLSPQEALIAGGSAEQFEQRVQTLYEEGHRNLICDLGEVWKVDSRGIRALVRGHTTAQRLGGSFKIANPHVQVRSILELSGLDRVLGIYDSVAAARKLVIPWKQIGVVVAVITLGTALVLSDIDWQSARFQSAAESVEGLPDSTPLPARGHLFDPLIRLLVAAAIGVLITAVHRPYVADRPAGRSMQQAQVLLAVAGAMIMIIIGNNIARAFGIAGAASIIRFRTPVEDPKDVTILFLLMGLGMSAGLGFYAVAGMGTAFLCLFLLLLEQVGDQKARTMRLDVVAEGKEFPTAYVQNVFVRNRMAFETKEVSLGDKVKVRYYVSIPAAAALEDLGAQLMGDGRCGVKSVSWEPVRERE